MRRCTAALTAGLVAWAAGTAPSTAEPLDAPEVVYSLLQVAGADWLVERGDDYYWYVAYGIRSHDPVRAKEKTYAFVRKTRCAVARTRQSTTVACSVGGVPERVPSKSFSFELDLSEARLAVEGHRLTWRGRGAAAPNIVPFADPAFGAQLWVLVERDARVSGTAFGSEVEGKRHDQFASLYEGVFAGAFTAASRERSFELRLDGSVHASARWTLEDS